MLQGIKNESEELIQVLTKARDRDASEKKRVFSQETMYDFRTKMYLHKLSRYVQQQKNESCSTMDLYSNIRLKDYL